MDEGPFLQTSLSPDNMELHILLESYLPEGLSLTTILQPALNEAVMLPLSTSGWH